MVLAESKDVNMVPEQQRCQGLLLFRRLARDVPGLNSGLDSTSVYESVCIGRNSRLTEGVPLDLWRYSSHERPELSATLSPTSESAVVSFACLGSAIYQSTADLGSDGGANPPPPFCRGLEVMQYSQALEAVAAQQQHAAAGGVASALPAPEQALSTASQVHPQQLTSPTQPMQPGPAVPTSSSNMGHSPNASPNPSSSDTTGASDSSSMSRIHRMLKQAGELAREASERLEGQDPLWFAKAFAARARINLEHMAKTGSQMAAAAAGRLPPEEEEQ